MKHNSVNSSKNIFQKASLSFVKHIIILLVAYWLLSALEIIFNGLTHEFPRNVFSVFVWSIVADTIFWLKLLWAIFILFFTSTFIL